MKKILKIPVIGPVLRWIIALVKLPVRFDALFDALSEYEKRINVLENFVSEYEKRINVLASSVEDVISESTVLREKHQTLQNKHDKLRDSANSLEQTIYGYFDVLNAHEASLHQCVQDIVEIRDKVQKGLFDNVIYDNDKMELLNRVLSLHMTVWGEKDKLHLSPLASLPGCLFNTNSGSISVGEYTFSGSNVSILAGSHDEKLSGLLRRDCEMTEGCDIVIGNGVWLASNCTLLGPCTIGDNAVIAAGAVVVPGTVVPENTVYAGVPAKFVKTLQPDNSIINKHAQIAMERSNKILFYSGWTEKRECLWQDKKLIGHWSVSNIAEIYTSASKMKIYLHTEDDSNSVIQITCSGKVIQKEITEDVAFVLEIPEKQNQISLILFEKINADFSVFVSANILE